MNTIQSVDLSSQIQSEFKQLIPNRKITEVINPTIVFLKQLTLTVQSGTYNRQQEDLYFWGSSQQLTDKLPKASELQVVLNKNCYKISLFWELLEQLKKILKMPRSIMSVLLVCLTLKSRRAIHTAFHSGLYHAEADRVIHKNGSYRCCCGREVVGDRLTFILIEALKII